MNDVEHDLGHQRQAIELVDTRELLRCPRDEGPPIANLEGTLLSNLMRTVCR